MKKNELLALMALHGDKQKDLCEALGVKKSAMGKKMRGESGWTHRDMVAIANRYQLSPEAFTSLFFEEVESF